MSGNAVQTLAIVSAVLALGCFIWQTIRRRQKNPFENAAADLRAPLWWGGLGFTVLALLLLWLAPGAA